MPKLTRWQRIRSGLRFAFGRNASPRIQTRPKQFQILQPRFRANQVEWHLVDYHSLVTHGYQMNAIIYSAIAYKWRQVSNAPLSAFEQNEAGFLEAVDQSDPLQQLLKRPNRSMSGDELSQLIVTYLNIAGNAYTVISRRNGQPSGLYPLRPDRMYIMQTPTDDDPNTITYWYRPANAGINTQDMIPILEQDIIHNKFPNPYDDLEGFGYGMSPLMPLAQSADVDNEVTRFLKVFFESGAVLPGYIQFDMELDQGIADEVADRWMELHGGVDQWGDVAVFERGGKYVPVTPPFKELGFEEIDKRNEARILGPLGVPAILVGSAAGIQTNTYGTATLQARRLFWEDTMLPELRQIDSEFSNKLGGGNRIVAYDTSQVPALVDRNVERVAAMAQLIETGTPRDEAYRLVGLPPVETPLGDASWMPSSLVPYPASTSFVGSDAIADVSEPEDGKVENVDSDKDIFAYHITEGVVDINEARAFLGLPPRDEAEARALQDLRKKLEVIKAALDAGFTQEQALALVGLDMDEQGKALLLSPVLDRPVLKKRVAKALPPRDGLKLPETVYIEALACIDNEIKAAQKAKRTFDWETLPYAWMATIDERDYIPLLAEFAGACYHSGLSGHRGRADFVELFG